MVEELDSNPMETLLMGEKSILEQLQEFLDSNGCKYAAIEYVPDRELYRLDIPRIDVKRAVELTQVFLREHEQRMMERHVREEIEAGNVTPEQLEEIRKVVAQKQMRKKSAVYESSEKKAEENRASALVLLAVGVVGLALILLCVTGVFRLPNIFNGSYMFFGVMGALSVLFIVMGLVSFKSAKGFQKNVESENTLKDSLETWCRENLKGEEIDKYIQMRTPGMEGESLFFPRIELIKARINHQFMNLDQDFLEQFVDEVVYEMVFPEENTQS